VGTLENILIVLVEMEKAVDRRMKFRNADGWCL